MSAPKKLRGGSDSELTRFKKLWRDSLAEDAREFWRQQFVSESTQAEIRKLLATRLKVNLSYDGQLNAFRDWELEQRRLDLEAERQIEDEKRIKEEFGEAATLDQIREEVLKRSYARAIATGDFAAGRKTIVQDLNVKKIALDRDKFEFDATKMALGKLETLKAIKGNSKLTEDEKLEQARLELFGSAPK